MTAIIIILIMVLFCIIVMNYMDLVSIPSLSTCNDEEGIVLYVYPDLTYINIRVYQYVPWCEHALDGFWYMGRSKEYGYTVLCHWHNGYYYRDIMFPSSESQHMWHWSDTKPYTGDIFVHDVYYTIDTSEDDWLASMEEEDLGTAYYPDPH